MLIKLYTFLRPLALIMIIIIAGELVRRLYVRGMYNIPLKVFLDDLQGVAIIVILAIHLIPLKRWRLRMGMALFGLILTLLSLLRFYL